MKIICILWFKVKLEKMFYTVNVYHVHKPDDIAISIFSWV